MPSYDIIGDIHGCATELKTLLAQLGYRPDDAGVYRHPERTAVFVGDLVDRGPGQLEGLEIVKAMVDHAGAHIVMGNHEFNAICYATPHPDKPGDFLRSHESPTNTAHHLAFLEQLTAERREHYIEWFKTLPLWLDLGGIRVIHACWNHDSMKVVTDATGGNRLTDLQHYVDASTKGRRLHEGQPALRCCRDTAQGTGDQSPGLRTTPYLDHGGKARTKARVRWWDADARTLRQLADTRGMKTPGGEDYPALPDLPVDDKYLRYVYTDHVPVIYGHYWFEWENHQDDWTDYTACVDYGAVKEDGKLVAYRWYGEPTITWRSYEPHTRDVVAETPSG